MSLVKRDHKGVFVADINANQQRALAIAFSMASILKRVEHFHLRHRGTCVPIDPTQDSVKDLITRHKIPNRSLV